MSTHACNCESLRCPVCQGNGCKNEAGAHRALYVGALCDGCADHMPKEYMVADTAIECPDCGSTAHLLCGEERTCDGSCDPMCAWCNRQADIAADNRMQEEGYE